MDNENDILEAIEEAEEIYYLIKRIKKTIENNKMYPLSRTK